MEIVIVAHGTKRTGGIRTLFEYCNGLLKLGHKVAVVSLGFHGDYNWFPLNTRVSYSQIGALLDFFNAAAKGNRLLPRSDEIYNLTNLIPECDVAVATYCLTATAVWRSALCRTRAYFAQHFEPYSFSDSYLSRWAVETYHLPIRKAANSLWLRNRIEELTGESVPVIPPGIDLSVFHPKEAAGPNLRKRIVAFAKSAPWKGFSDLVAALRILERTRNDLELITYGSWRPPKLLERSHQRHVGRLSDDELSTLYSTADVVVSSSWFESFPLPPLEAMACGAPVVTTGIGTEDYAVDMENALVVPPRNPAVLADSVARILEDPSLGQSFRRKAIETARRFDWESAVRKMEAFLADVSNG